jgi:beta-glucanase (GH16 family)
MDDPFSGFHVYSVDWNGDRIKFLVDNVVYFTYYKHMNPTQTWPFDGYFNIILNLGSLEICLNYAVYIIFIASFFPCNR